MHNTTRPIDTKREEYRKYLERTGVLEAISRCLTKLYDETDKPTDAVGFVYKMIGESFPEKDAEAKKLQADLEEERKKVTELTNELEIVKSKLVAFEKAAVEAEDEDAMLADAVTTAPVIVSTTAATVSEPEPPTPVPESTAVEVPQPVDDVVMAEPAVEVSETPAPAAPSTTVETIVPPPAQAEVPIVSAAEPTTTTDTI